MIILRQREFGNAANKAAKKALEMSLADGKSPEDIARLRQELRDGAMIGGTIKTKDGGVQDFTFNSPNRNSKQAELDKRINRRGKTTASGGANVYKAGYNSENEFGVALKKQRLKNAEKIDTKSTSPQPKIQTGPTSSPQPNKNLGSSGQSKSTGAGFFNKASNFANKTWNGEIGLGKVGNRAAIIGGTATAIGTGAYLLHRRNKKKREEEKKKL